MTELSAVAETLRRTAELFDSRSGADLLAGLHPDEARSVLDVANAAAEAARAAREILSLAADHAAYDGRPQVVEEIKTRLPLNRKERYYTATVLPLLLAGDGFAHLGRFVELCGLQPNLGSGRRDGSAPCQVVTEYGFAESLFGADDPRWDARVRFRDTPDVVLVGPDWLVAVEAKMFHRPSTADLEAQMSAQAKLIEEWTDVLGIDPGRVRHVALLPSGLANEMQRLRAPIVTWEQVADRYRIVGPAYWVGIINEATDRWSTLTAAPTTFGQNADARLTGQEILNGAIAGNLGYAFMGRRGGLEGSLLATDLETGAWRTRQYEVRAKPIPSNPNWFAVADFVVRVGDNVTTQRASGVRRGR